MRVLFFMTADIRTAGGSAIRARLLIQGIQQLGIQVGVASLGLPQSLIDAGVQFRHLSDFPTFYEALIRFGREFKPDIIYGITEGFADSVVKASKEIDCKCGFDVHAVGVFEILELGSGFGSRRKRILNSIKWLSAFTKANFLTINPLLLYDLTRRVSSSCHYINNMVDLSHFSPEGVRADFPENGCIKVLYAGNLLKWQGCPMLLEAAQMMIDKGLPYQFTFIGSFGSSYEMTRYNIIEALGKLRFIEQVSYGAIPSFLRAADILVIPRPNMLSTNFAAPNKLGDYMASGKAVLATNIYPHRKAITNGQNGLLCIPSPNGLMHGLIALSEPEVRKELGANARKYAEQNFDYFSQCQKVLSVIEKVIS